MSETKLNNIVKILMSRDNLTQSEAENVFKNAQRDINDVLENGGNYSDVEDIMYCQLGLEMDYIFDILHG